MLLPLIMIPLGWARLPKNGTETNKNETTFLESNHWTWVRKEGTLNMLGGNYL